MAREFIVVPESLEADAQGRPTDRPSFVYRQVLDHVRVLARPDDTVYLAPANAFGGAVREEAAAWAYLMGAAPPSFALLCPGRNLGDYRPPAGYIDTFGNAAELLRLVAVAGRSFELVVARPHARRAAWCFRQCGFVLAQVHCVPIRIERSPVVRRTFYYRHPPLHRAYEALAYLRDRWKYRRSEGPVR